MIGSFDCGRCRAVKNMLTMRGVEFHYSELEKVDSDQIKEVYNSIIDREGSVQLPLILDGSNNIVELQSIL